MASTATIVSVGRAAGGFWRVTTDDDRLGGIFATRKAAVSFARAEARMLKPVRAVISEDAPDR